MFIYRFQIREIEAGMVSSTENTEMNWAWDRSKSWIVVISEMTAYTGVVPRLSSTVVLNCVATFARTAACSTVQYLRRQIVTTMATLLFVWSSDSLSGIGSNRSCSLCRSIWRKKFNKQCSIIICLCTCGIVNSALIGVVYALSVIDLVVLIGIGVSHLQWRSNRLYVNVMLVAVI